MTNGEIERHYQMLQAVRSLRKEVARQTQIIAAVGLANSIQKDHSNLSRDELTILGNCNDIMIKFIKDFDEED